MVDKIIKVISKTLNQVFGDDFEIYFSKDVQQGLKEPCFFIALVGSSRIRRIGNRYRMFNSFDVQYFPRVKRGNIEMIGVAEQLLDALEFIQLSDTQYTSLELKYNTWGIIKDFTWGYLKSKTWKEIKDEVLTADAPVGDLVQGTTMNYSIQDGVLHFFVDYNVFLKKDVPLEEMETLTVDANTTQEG